MRSILGIFTIAGATVLLTGCDDWQDFGNLIEGKPTKAQIAAEAAPRVVYHVSSPVVEAAAVPVVEPVVEAVVDVPVAAVASVTPVADPADCVVPAHLFRTMQCDEGGQLIPIR